MSTPLLNRRRLMMQMAGGGGGEYPLPDWCRSVDSIYNSGFYGYTIPNFISYPTHPPIMSGKILYYKVRWGSGVMNFVSSGCFSLAYSRWTRISGVVHTFIRFLFNGTQWGDEIELPYNTRDGVSRIHELEYDGNYVYFTGYEIKEDESLEKVCDETILFGESPNVVETYVQMFGGKDPLMNSGNAVYTAVRYYELEVKTEGGHFKLIPSQAYYSGAWRDVVFDSISNTVWRINYAAEILNPPT